MTLADLPHGWGVRRPTLDDVDELLGVVHASDIAAVGEPDFSRDDVLDGLTGRHTDPARDSWVAVDEAGAIVGWAYIDNGAGGPRDFVEVYVHPERGLPAQRPLLALALARVPERAAELGHERMTVRAGAIPTEKIWIESLQAAGFHFVKRYARMQITFPSPETAPADPRIDIRTATPEDLPEFFQVFDTAFRDTPDYQPETLDSFTARWITGTEVHWDEWFIATVDGVPVGILQSSGQSLDNNEGWIKHLAVLREYRRLGAARALLARAFAVYAVKGRTGAGLGVDLANPTHAARLYAAIGMTPKYEADIFELPR